MSFFDGQRGIIQEGCFNSEEVCKTIDRINATGEAEVQGLKEIDVLVGNAI